jgi:hypothetical protein
MDPQNQYQPPAYTGNSLEYLNQISSKKTPSAGFLNKKVIAIFGAVVLVLIVVIVVVANSGKPTTPSGQILGYRITGLNELITFGETSTINDSGLRKALAETKVIALSENYQISTYITLPKTDSKTPVPSDESVTQTVSSLTKAVASGSFNKDYAAALIAQIGKVKTALLEIQAQSTSQATVAKIDEDLAQYSAVADRLTDY